MKRGAQPSAAERSDGMVPFSRSRRRAHMNRCLLALCVLLLLPFMISPCLVHLCFWHTVYRTSRMLCGALALVARNRDTPTISRALDIVMPSPSAAEKSARFGIVSHAIAVEAIWIRLRSQPMVDEPTCAAATLTARRATACKSVTRACSSGDRPRGCRMSARHGRLDVSTGRLTPPQRGRPGPYPVRGHIGQGQGPYRVGSGSRMCFATASS
jgi:hypothetical protein